MLLAVMLILPVFAEENETMEDIEKESASASVDRINPLLSKISQINLVFNLPSQQILDTNDIDIDKIKNKIRMALFDNNIKVVDKPDAINVPDLKIRINLLKLELSGMYAYQVQTSLARKVTLMIYPRRIFKADLWKVGTTIGAAQTDEIAEAVTQQLDKQLELFIAAFTAANAAGTNDKDPLSQRVTNRELLQYKYVASKNSSIFHRPQCHLAKRIKSKNLIGYQTREHAVEDGKRPCKGCDP